VISGHFGRAIGANRSVFSVTQAELRALLQSKTVVRAKVYHLGNGIFARTVDVGRHIGTSSLNNGGKATKLLRVFTDEAGNLITAFPL
jgi:filamentous hemagglutinin